MAFSPVHTGLLATGSYSQTTAIYTEDNMELLYVLHGQQGGVTHVSMNSLIFSHWVSIVKKAEGADMRLDSQVMFSKDGNYLYTGGRKVLYINPSFLRDALLH